MLYHLLPVVIWLLAIGGSAVPIILQFILPYYTFPNNYLWAYLVAAIVLLCLIIIGHIKRHESSTEECFGVAVLLGIGSYWLPSVVFLILPIWIYLIHQNLFHFRNALASIIGFAFVAVWASIAIFMGWIPCPWATFFSIENAYGWIPTSAVLLAWFSSTIVRRILRVR